MSVESGAPAEKKRRLSLSLKKPKADSRFEFTTAQSVEEAQKGVISENMRKATEYAVRVFRTWVTERNKAFPCDQCPQDVLLSNSRDTLSKGLCFFCKEMRKPMGSLTLCVQFCRFWQGC